MINLDWIRQLIDMVDESDIDSLEISRFGTRVRVSKSPPVHVVAGGGASSAPAGVAGGKGAGAVTEQSVATPNSSEESPIDDSIVEVVSPMVGTFYPAPAPDAPPYVEVGDRISKGQTLCILEAMKLMNELEAEVSGTVRAICVESGDPVEYGQTIFHIESD